MSIRSMCTCLPCFQNNHQRLISDDEIEVASLISNNETFTPYFLREMPEEVEQLSPIAPLNDQESCPVQTLPSDLVRRVIDMMAQNGQALDLLAVSQTCKKFREAVQPALTAFPQERLQQLGFLLAIW